MNIPEEMRAQANQSPEDVDLSMFDVGAARIEELESALIKPLKWTEPRKGHIYIPYDHVIAETPMGNFEITWKSWKSHANYDINHSYFDYIGSCYSLEEAKSAAQQYHNNMITSCLQSPEVV